MAPRSTKSSRYLSSFLPILFFAACTAQPSSSSFTSGSTMQTGQSRQDQILLGRHMVVSHACGECHGGGDNPAAAGWLDGMRDTITQQFRAALWLAARGNAGRRNHVDGSRPGQLSSASPLSGGADAVDVVAQHVRPGALCDCGVPQGRTETGESQGAGQRRPA